MDLTDDDYCRDIINLVSVFSIRKGKGVYKVASMQEVESAAFPGLGFGLNPKPHIDFQGGTPQVPSIIPTYP